MKKLLLISVGLITLLLTSCGGDNASETPAPAPSPAAQAPAPQPSPSPEPAKAEPEPEKPPLTVSGLTPPTDPDKRTEVVSSGKSDPFTSIEIDLDKKGDPGELKSRPINPTPGNDGNETTQNPPTPPDPSPSPSPIVPESPTELAEQVEITGVFDNGDKQHIIVKAPNESYSRYVEVGQYIAQGQVLVKRIDLSQNPPRVILEESGVEYAKEVGETPTQPPPEKLSQLPPPPPISNP